MKKCLSLLLLSTFAMTTIYSQSCDSITPDVPDITSPHQTNYTYSCSVGWTQYYVVYYEITVSTGCSWWRTCYRKEKRSKQASRTLYRSQYKNSTKCIDGYRLDKNKMCIPSCERDGGCVHGDCTKPYTCVCNDGYIGSSCSATCPYNSFGAQCKQACKCFNGAQCNTVNGSCYCTEGWKGQLCNETCPLGFYGKQCQQECDCSNNATCHHISAACICNGGYEGKKCEKVCSEGFFGHHCKDKCMCKNNATCHPEDGACNCTSGWKGARCNIPCEKHYFGPGCVDHCKCDDKNSVACNPVDGGCLCKPGFTIDSDCKKSCLNNTYGEDCQSTCACSPENTHVCHTETGFCTCKKDWNGVNCNQPCGSNFLFTINDVAMNESCVKECINCDVNNGVCQNTTGICRCNAGFHGDSCKIPCDDDKYGVNCLSDCNCKNNATCSPLDGSCNCTSGWTGADCSYKCDEGLYGEGCRNKCTCGVFGKCDRFTGECKCFDEYQGTNCTEKCDNWMFGLDCTHPCVCNKNNSIKCHGMTGNCTCKVGWLQDTCDIQQDCINSFGENCQSTCKCVNEAVCDSRDGSCACQEGFTGEICDKVCPTGRFGRNCIHPCTCGAGGICNKKNGSCTCLPGYYGEKCSQECDSGFYGKDCLQVCQCKNGGICSKLVGSCHCIEPGYYGKFCEEPCKADWYGQECTKRCQCAPNNNTKSCSHIDGECLCNPGFKGKYCDQICSVGKWGDRCTNDCYCLHSVDKNQTCDAESGQCLCVDGYKGIQCNQVCDEFHFGAQCLLDCNCTDNRMNGQCNSTHGICECKPGFIGYQCNTTCSAGMYGVNCAYRCPCEGCDARTGSCKDTVMMTVLTTYLPVVAVVIVLLILIVVVVYRKKYMNKKSDESVAMSDIQKVGFSKDNEGFEGSEYGEYQDASQLAEYGKVKPHLSNPIYTSAHDTPTEYDELFKQKHMIKTRSENYSKLGPISSLEESPSSESYDHISSTKNMKKKKKTDYDQLKFPDNVEQNLLYDIARIDEPNNHLNVDDQSYNKLSKKLTRDDSYDSIHSDKRDINTVTLNPTYDHFPTAGNDTTNNYDSLNQDSLKRENDKTNNYDSLSRDSLNRENNKTSNYDYALTIGLVTPNEIYDSVQTPAPTIHPPTSNIHEPTEYAEVGNSVVGGCNKSSEYADPSTAIQRNIVSPSDSYAASNYSHLGDPITTPQSSDYDHLAKQTSDIYQYAAPTSAPTAAPTAAPASAPAVERGKKKPIPSKRSKK